MQTPLSFHRIERFQPHQKLLKQQSRQVIETLLSGLSQEQTNLTAIHTAAFKKNKPNLHGYRALIQSWNEPFMSLQRF